MARIRTIKPEFWTSEQVVECSIEARLLFIGIWNFCDDHGIHPANPRRIKMQIYPADEYDSESIRRMLSELSTNGLIHIYTIGNKEFLQVTGWDKHQRIDKPTYRYPPPVAVDSGTGSRAVVEPSGTDRNGMDGNGAEPLTKTNLLPKLVNTSVGGRRDL